MPSREEIVHDISAIANWCEDQAASSALEDLSRQVGNMRCENCDSKDELLKEMAEALEKLSRLGNEPYLGNSIGNLIAQEALKKYHEQIGEPK